MTTAHTPGPWNLVQYAYSTAWSVQAFTGMKGLPSETGFSAMATPAPHGRDKIGEQLANARLISAAPDMLAALKSAMEDFGSDFTGPTIDAMRAAITKAEGGA